MTREIVTAAAPSRWAPYLINDDATELDDDEIAQADAFAAWLGGNIVTCEERGFMWRHGATQFGVLACDCQLYHAIMEG